MAGEMAMTNGKRQMENQNRLRLNFPHQGLNSQLPGKWLDCETPERKTAGYLCRDGMGAGSPVASNIILGEPD
jgi:hypothetical protein